LPACAHRTRSMHARRALPRAHYAAAALWFGWLANRARRSRRSREPAFPPLSSLVATPWRRYERPTLWSAN